MNEVRDRLKAEVSYNVNGVGILCRVVTAKPAVQVKRGMNKMFPSQKILKSGNMGLFCTFAVRHERFQFYFQHRSFIFNYYR